ncbi:MAG TPA: PEP-CTERM sorting domain-containing protein [Bryobacteraceae bacterium]|nr:PEP-CTERM sorting domain-containing protein [Bryobacteraceae bacterium]
MKNSMMRLLVWAWPCLMIPPAMASLVNVTGSAEVTLNNGDSLVFHIADPDGGCHPSYPNEIEMVIGSLPLGGPVTPIPGTSQGYLAGWLFSATLESADGSFSLPLTDADATRLGLGTGTLVLTPGARSGGSYAGPIDVLSAAVTLTPAQAAELFASGDPVIELRNIGDTLTLGYPGSTIGNDFSASLISGWQSQGARVTEVDCRHASARVPEPGTLGLLLIGGALLVGRARHKSR